MGACGRILADGTLPYRAEAGEYYPFLFMIIALDTRFSLILLFHRLIALDLTE